MNKKLLAVAIAGAIAAPMTALADEGNVKLYGSANVSVDSIDNGKDRTTNVSSNQSVLGVEGYEGLGNGLKAVFHFDVFAGYDTGSSAAGLGGPAFLGGARDSWAGLAGAFGTVALGAQGRPWKTATNNVDIFVNTIADYSSIIGSTKGGVYLDSGIGNSIIWFAPSANGFSGHAQYGFDETPSSNSDQWGAQVNYSNGPWGATYAYSDQKNSGQTAGLEDITAHKASLSYTFGGATTVSAIYDNIQSDASGSANERDAWWLGVSHNLGNNTFKLAYARADDSNAPGGNDGAAFLAVGVSHHLSKRTEVYGLYARTNNDNNGNYNLGGSQNATSGVTSPASPGQDVSAFSLGFKHNF